MEDYLKVIYQLERETDGRVKTASIADRLDVSAPSVSSMLKKLAGEGLVDYEEYRGVTLTSTGEAVALEVIRHHRLLEAFLSNQLDYDWSEVHEEADRLEHHISQRFADRIAELLDHPTIDPHGDPIPGSELNTTGEESFTSLTDFDEGDTIRVERVRDQDPEILTYLADRGITPGTRVELIEIAPFGMITIRSESESDPVSLPNHIAMSVNATPSVS